LKCELCIQQRQAYFTELTKNMVKEGMHGLFKKCDISLKTQLYPFPKRAINLADKDQKGMHTHAKTENVKTANDSYTQTK